MIVRGLKVKYVCINPMCAKVMSISASEYSSRDITDVCLGITRNKNCHACSSYMAIREVECKVSTDRFGTDMTGEWICNDHPYQVFYTVPLRKAYKYQLCRIPALALYKEIIQLGFPWKCPTCREQLKYADRRDSAFMG